MEYGNKLLKFILEELGYPIHYEVVINYYSFSFKIISEAITEDIVTDIKKHLESISESSDISWYTLDFWDNNTLLIHLEI